MLNAQLPIEAAAQEACSWASRRLAITALSTVRADATGAPPDCVCYTVSRHGVSSGAGDADRLGDAVPGCARGGADPGQSFERSARAREGVRRPARARGRARAGRAAGRRRPAGVV